MCLKVKSLVLNAVTGRHGFAVGLSVLALAMPAQAYARDSVRIPTNLCSWETMSWNDLNAVEKAAWSGLGWTRQNWDNSEPANYPASYRKSWPELVYAEKLLARELGFSRKTWDAEGCPNYSTRVRKEQDTSDQAGTNSSVD